MNTKLKFMIPFLALILIFGFALACVGEPTKEEVSKTEEEATEEEKVEEEATVSEEGETVKSGEIRMAPATVKEIKDKGEQIPLGQTVEVKNEYRNLKISIIKCEFADSYKAQYKMEYPEEEGKFLWVYVKTENIGKSAWSLPETNCFDVLHIDVLIGPTWIRPDDKKPYEPEKVLPGVSREGWLLYVIPKDAKVEDMLIACDSNFPFAEFYYWEIQK